MAVKTDPTYKDVSLAEFLKHTEDYKDADTFRWLTVNESLSIRVSFGAVRAGAK